MDLNYLRRLVKIFDDSTLDDLVIEEEGTKIKFSRKPQNASKYEYPLIQNDAALGINQVFPISTTEKLIPKIEHHETKTETQISKSEDTIGLVEVLSPMVGTFYRAPSPEAQPFVEVGKHVTKGQVVCIIEAMKLMNQIESEINGVIEKILIDNAKPVEFGQPLFLVKPE